MRILVTVSALLLLSACVDLNDPRPWACRADASVSQLATSSDCSEGQICGFEGFCRSKDEPGPFLCDRSTGFGCGAGWFCAVDGVCRDVDAGGPFSCERFDGSVPPNIPTFADGGPNDCGNAGWRCGAGGTCQQIGVGGEYKCNDDSDCEARGRCGGEGVCVNPELDRLLDRDAGPLIVTVLSPRAIHPNAESFTFSSAPPKPLPFVQVTNGSVEIFDESLGQVFLGDAGPNVVSSGVTEDSAFVSSESGFLVLPSDGSSSTSYPQLAGATIRNTSSQALAFNDAGLLFMTGGLVDPPKSLVIPDGGDVTDMAFVPGFGGLNLPVCALAMHSAGLALGTYDEKNSVFTFAPIDLGVCIGNCGTLIKKLDGRGFKIGTSSNALTITSTLPPAGGPAPGGFGRWNTPEVSLFSATWDPNAGPTGTGGGASTGPSCAPKLTPVFLNCALPCAAAQLVDVRPAANASGLAHAVCREEQAGRPVLTMYSMSDSAGVCSLKAEFVESSLFSTNARVSAQPGFATAVGQLGQIWSISRWDNPKILTLDHAATGSVTFSDGGTFLFADPVVAYPAPMGLLATQATDVLFEKPVAEVDGTPDWYVGESRHIIEGPRDVRGSIKLNGGDFQPPIHAQRVVRSDGKVVVVASARDTLLAAELPPDGGFFEALPRLVPQARVDIVSFALSGDVPDGGYVAGYLLTTGGVFQLGADAINRWHVSELSLPESDPLALWTDGLRGRVGMPTGVIYSLPSRVRIAPELKGTDGTPLSVVDYATLCGEPFALTSQGLFRLGYGEITL